MVSRRRGSLEKLDAELKALSKRLPASDQFFDAIFSLVHADHNPASLDRTAAIAGTQFVEYALQRAITRHLKDPLPPREEKDLFEGGGGGPLSAFGAKIILAHALGVIDDEDREDLDTLRYIRNAFAHSVTPIKFDDEAVKKLCVALHASKLVPGVSGIEDVLGAQYVFVQVAAHLYFSLVTYFPGRDLKPVLVP
jgi:hypothetical protein